jgi:hypothetical protein
VTDEDHIFALGVLAGILIAVESVILIVWAMYL